MKDEKTNWQRSDEKQKEKTYCVDEDDSNRVEEKLGPRHVPLEIHKSLNSTTYMSQIYALLGMKIQC